MLPPIANSAPKAHEPLAQTALAPLRRVVSKPFANSAPQVDDSTRCAYEPLAQTARATLQSVFLEILQFQCLNSIFQLIKDRTGHVRDMNIKPLVVSGKDQHDVGSFEFPQRIFFCKTELNTFDGIQILLVNFVETASGWLSVFCFQCCLIIFKGI